MIKIKAIILSGGYATRLYPLTENQPKSLLNIGDKPMIEHIADQISKIKEVDKVYVVTNHRFYDSFRAWAMDYKTEKKIKVINDGTLKNEDRLGAVGDLNFVLKEELIDDEVLMIAGDNLFGFKLNDMVKYFQKKKGSVLAFYDMKEKKKVAKKFGVGILDKEEKVVDFEEKPAEPRSTLAATCCYLFSKKDVGLVGEYIRMSNKWDNPGDFAKWLMKRSVIYGYVFKEHWFDIGSFEGLEEANKFYKGN
ncbi:MAG: nucleotidyltransferase family protein [Candidatus Woesearchaeota archaeon]